VLSAGILAMLTAGSLSIHGAAALGVGIGLLPWLHTRFAPVAGVLASSSRAGSCERMAAGDDGRLGWLVWSCRLSQV
jgi:hypothetical protein